MHGNDEMVSHFSIRTFLLPSGFCDFATQEQLRINQPFLACCFARTQVLLPSQPQSSARTTNGEKETDEVFLFVNDKQARKTGIPQETDANRW